MKARLFRSKRQGQSIIIIALIIVVLVGMVGLSVDVGNTYAQNRNAVRATNAAALAAMDKLIKGGDDASIGQVIVASFQSNGITAQINPADAPADGARQILARYLDSNGNPIGACTIGSCGAVPTNVSYIQINTTGRVDTYFARVLGQQTLPVNAQAFAAQCTPVNGVYPIAVNASDLDENGFIPPTNPNEMPYYGRYSDTNYQNLTARRIYRRTTFGLPGSFDWLQWNPAPSGGSAVSTGDMLTNDGDLDRGFGEVTPWPDPNLKMPTGYPLVPGQLTEGDWIRGNVGRTNSSDVVAALEFHKTHGTIMNLPIIDHAIGNGQNAAFHFNRMGAFMLRGYDVTGSQPYFDLVYVGQALNTACLNTNVSQGLKGLGLVGQAFVNPRWIVNQSANQPVAYNIVLDVSGSMSWDFHGYGTYDGSNTGGGYTVNNGVRGDVQCESPDNDGSTLPFTDRCIGGRNSAWHNVSERRIYVAKNAIKNFINRMNPYDTMRIISFSTSQTGNAAASSAWSSDKATLTNTVMNAGNYGGNSYLTDGGTPGPQALDKAAKMFLASNGYTPTAGNGQTFKPVVIYVTDGVANIFMNGTLNSARDIPFCAAMSANQAESTADPCQLGTTSSGQRRPISAMVDVANNMKASMPNLEIYALGLAHAPDTGLPLVANDSSYYYPATQANAVDNILTQIQARAVGDTCSAGGGFSWTNSIGSANAPDPSSNPTIGNGIFGYVYIYPVNGATPKYVLPIQHDNLASGHLGFSIPPPDPTNPNSTGITPGNYEMEAFIRYKGKDGQTRQYDYFISQSSLREAHRVPFSVSSGATLGSTVAIDPIFMDMSSSTHVCPATP